MTQFQVDLEGEAVRLELVARLRGQAARAEADGERDRARSAAWMADQLEAQVVLDGPAGLVLARRVVPDSGGPRQTAICASTAEKTRRPSGRATARRGRR